MLLFHNFKISRTGEEQTEDRFQCHKETKFITQQQQMGLEGSPSERHRKSCKRNENL